MPASPTKSLTQARSALGVSSLVSMWWAEATMSCSSLALGVDALGQRLGLVGQRMAPARLGEALHQRVGLGVEKQHAQIDPVPPQLGDRGAAAP